jgi:hypothetical protein
VKHVVGPLIEPPRVWWRVGYPASCCYTGVI